MLFVMTVEVDDKCYRYALSILVIGSTSVVTTPPPVMSAAAGEGGVSVRNFYYNAFFSAKFHSTFSSNFSPSTAVFI